MVLRLLCIVAAAAALAGCECGQGCHKIQVVVTPPGTADRDAVFVTPIATVGCNTPCGQTAIETRYAANLSITLQDHKVSTQPVDARHAVLNLEVQVLVGSPALKDMRATFRGTANAEGSSVAHIALDAGGRKFSTSVTKAGASTAGINLDAGGVFDVTLPEPDWSTLEKRKLRDGREVYVYLLRSEISVSGGTATTIGDAMVSSIDVSSVR